MKTIFTIRTVARGALLAACIPAMLLLALTATAGRAKAATAGHSPAAPAAKGGSAHSGQTMPAALRPVFYQALAKDAGATYHINKDGCAMLAKQTLEGCFDAGGAHFTLPATKAGSMTPARSANEPLSLHLVAFGRGDKLAAVTSVRPKITGNQASYRHGAINEWWRVLPVGFEQGFTIAERPSGNGELTLALAMNPPNAGAPTTRHSRAEPAPAKAWGGNPVEISPSIPLRSEGGNEVAWGKLRYGQLVVTDAKGKVVPATLMNEGDRILIAVNDTHVAYPLTVDPLVWLEQKVIASDGAAGDIFGQSVALDGTTAVVGAPDASTNGNSDQGAAYVFSKSNGSWTQTARLAASDGVAGDNFGWAVALKGTTALIGAPHVVWEFGIPCNGSAQGGAAYVFSESNGTWIQTSKITASDGRLSDCFGYSVALDGTTALIGAPGTGPVYLTQGAAYVFSESGGIWTQTQELFENDGLFFGFSVAISGTTAVVGAPQCAQVSSFSCSAAGAVYTFIESAGNWTQAAEFTASDGAIDDLFGSSVALAPGSTTALVGAPCPFYDPDTNLCGPGAAYVFGESDGNWTQTAELTASDGAANDEFGNAVALVGSTAVVGANQNRSGGPGAAYVFDGSTGTWTQTQKYTASDGAAGDGFGDSVALDGTTALVGAVGANSLTGGAYFEDQSDLDLLTTAPRSAFLGDTYLMQAIATNEATATSPAVAVTVTVPAAASFVSASAIPGNCNESSNLVTCKFGPLGSGGVAFANVNLKATGLPGATIENNASVSKATPKLSDGASTVILATCPAGYTRYSGTLAPNARYRTPPYQSAAGKQTVTFDAPLDFVLHVGYQKNAQSQWVIRTFARHAIYQHGPAGTYEWQINAGPDGGAYTLCILHP